MGTTKFDDLMKKFKKYSEEYFKSIQSISIDVDSSEDSMKNAHLIYLDILKIDAMDNFIEAIRGGDAPLLLLGAAIVGLNSDKRHAEMMYGDLSKLKQELSGGAAMDAGMILDMMEKRIQRL